MIHRRILPPNNTITVTRATATLHFSASSQRASLRRWATQTGAQPLFDATTGKCIYLDQPIWGFGDLPGTTNRQAILDNLKQLLSFTACVDPQPWGLLTPVQAHATILNLQKGALQPRTTSTGLKRNRRLITIFPHNYRWTLLIIEKDTETTATARCWGCPQQDIALQLACAVNLHMRRQHEQTQPGTCGAISLAHFGHELQLWDHLTDEHIHHWHSELAQTPNQQAGLYAKRPKGPKARPSNRSTCYRSTISATTASRPATRFRWISTEELEAHIANNAPPANSARVQEADSSQQDQNTTTFSIDPAQLYVIPEGAFLDNDRNIITPTSEASLRCRPLPSTLSGDTRADPSYRRSAATRRLHCAPS